MKKSIFLLMLFQIQAQELTLKLANQLAELPLKCLTQEYPNKLNQVLKDSTELESPQTLHPTFYGCFDWHSAVHGHWSLVFLVNNFNDLNNREKIIDLLKKQITPKNIAQEIKYFEKPHEKSFERTYGWAWFLKLQLALHESPEPRLKALSEHLDPLCDLIVERYLTFLPKLLYPVRAGTHNNTAFGLNFAYDYALYFNHYELKTMVENTAFRLFDNDRNYPLNWEPSGTDFLSPCLETAALMSRIKPEKAFLEWLKKFHQGFLNKPFTWEVAKVSDRTDGHLVHLDGLNFSRAWNFYFLANKYPKKLGHLSNLASKHLQFSISSIIDGNYEGEHWLASFLLHAFENK